jgi:uncharacterized protein YqgV (UPF0045/DUF77 family)
MSIWNWEFVIIVSIFTTKITHSKVIDADYVKQLDEILATKNMKNELQPTLGESAMGDWSQIFYLIQSTLQFSCVPNGCTIR